MTPKNPFNGHIERLNAVRNGQMRGASHPELLLSGSQTIQVNLADIHAGYSK